MTKTILVPLDGSRNSIKAYEHAIKLAKLIEGNIIVINVQPNYESIHTKNFINKKDIDEYTEEKAMEILNQIETPDNIEVQKKYKIGVPEMQICKEADAQDVFCIVMGSRGLGPIIGKIIGSVGYGVIKLSTKPVTIVPHH